MERWAKEEARGRNSQIADQFGSMQTDQVEHDGATQAEEAIMPQDREADDIKVSSHEKGALRKAEDEV